MERVADVSLSTARVKADLSCGIEHHIANLRKLDWKKRLPELIFFPSLFASGVAINILSVNATAYAAGSRVVGTVMTAVALNAFVLLLHEGMHNTLFKNRVRNWCASVLFGGTVLISFTAYQVMHTRHHIYLGDRRDPDDYQNYTRSRTLLWLLHYVRLLFGAFLYILVIPLMAYRHGSPGERRRIVVEYGLLGSGYALLLASLPHQLLLRAWIMPLVIVAYMVNVRGFTQHGMTDAGDPLLASRSIEANRVVAFCLLNENYHLEHHLFPDVPSYNLAGLHAHVGKRLPRAVKGASYLGFLHSFFRATLTRDETPIGLTIRGGQGTEPEII